MGKQGPCCHCGVTSTPLWRNGPPEKPVLCNACGSRWRTKGTLANYTPLHARPEPDDFLDHKFSRVKSISVKNNEAKIFKRKPSNESTVGGGTNFEYYQCSPNYMEEDTSNRSSSGSAVSNNESCAQFSSADASDLTGPAQSIVWDTMVPSRKRTCVNRPKPSPVEKLTKDLYNILHEQSTYFSGSSEDDLLFESDTPMVSVEIGHGSVLIRHPSSITREEESEASSLSVDNKLDAINEAYPVHNIGKDVTIRKTGIEKTRRPTRLGMEQEQLKRDSMQHKDLHILGNRDSPLSHIDLKDVLSFDEFTSHLTDEEKHQLLNYLPPIDTVKLPDSLMAMFDSAQFKDDMSCFHKLLVEGVFDLSLPNVNIEDCRTLKRLALCNLTTFKWVEQYSQLKNIECQSSNCKAAVLEQSAVASLRTLNAKRSREGQYENITGRKVAMKNPKRVKAGYEQKEEDDRSYFSPSGLFALPPGNSSTPVDSFHVMDESSDQDLLLDVPCNSSFPQAELLPTTSFGAQVLTSSSSSICPNLIHR